MHSLEGDTGDTHAVDGVLVDGKYYTMLLSMNIGSGTGESIPLLKNITVYAQPNDGQLNRTSTATSNRLGLPKDNLGETKKTHKQ